MESQNKRRVIFILIVAFVIASIIFLVWFLRPIFLKAPGQQPPSLPSGIVPQRGSQPEQMQPKNQEQPSVPVQIKVRPGANAEEQQIESALKQQAEQFVSRASTYSNADHFASIRDAYTGIAPSMQVYLENERKRLDREHPGPVPSWSQATRCLASRVVTVGTPLTELVSVDVVVQARQTVSVDAQEAVVFKEAVVSMKREAENWIIERITWQELNQL